MSSVKSIGTITIPVVRYDDLIANKAKVSVLLEILASAKYGALDEIKRLFPEWKEIRKDEIDVT